MATEDVTSEAESREKDTKNYSPRMTIYLKENLSGDSPKKKPADVQLTLWTDGNNGFVITKTVSKDGKLLTREDPNSLSEEIVKARKVFDDYRQIGMAQYSWPGFYRQLQKGEPITDPLNNIDASKLSKLVSDMGPFLEQSERAFKMGQISSQRAIYIDRIAKQSLSNLTRTI